LKILWLCGCGNTILMQNLTVFFLSNI